MHAAVFIPGNSTSAVVSFLLLGSLGSAQHVSGELACNLPLIVLSLLSILPWECGGSDTWQPPHLAFKGGSRQLTQTVRPMPSSQSPVFIC